MAAVEVSDPVAAKPGRSRRRLAWAAPIVVAGAVAAGVVAANVSSSDASVNLPARSAAQLLTAVQTSSAAVFSGDVREIANLGLPALPGGRSSASLSWQAFISGAHSARVWADGVDKQRIALVGELSEADVVHDGKDVWTYTSDTNTVTHSVVPVHAGRTDLTPAATDLSPAAAAAKVLKLIGPSTTVGVESAKTVASRAAYVLVLVPRDTNSTVRKVTIAIDAEKSIPLRVQVFGAGSAPALQIGFTRISFTSPPASTFVFRTPKGATVSTDPLGTSATHRDGRRGRHDAVAAPRASAPPSAKPKVIGADWTSVVELAAGSMSSALLDGQRLSELTSAVGSSGMRLLHTALINAVTLPDGRVFAGAVKPALLEHIAAATPR